MVRGSLYKSSAGWNFWDGNSYSSDAATMRVSAVGIQISGASFSSAPLSADSSSVSAKQESAANLRVSAFSDSAALFRVSALGITLAASQSLSARNLEGTAFIGSVSCGGGLVSATMKEGTSFIGQVSTILKDNPVNATYLGRVSVVNASATGEGTAFIGQVSAILRDNATTATYLGRVSAIQGDAANQQTSAKSNDAGTLRTSAYLPVDTVGQMTAFRSLSLSASQAVKGSAGAIYGYYLWNTTTVPQYVKFTNTSGAINVGTDTPLFMAMLPASAAANVWFGQGVKGFTNGIGVHASSAVADNATTPAAASAVGGTIFYN
jgi:hypothetical protein